METLKGNGYTDIQLHSGMVYNWRCGKASPLNHNFSAKKNGQTVSGTFCYIFNTIHLE